MYDEQRYGYCEVWLGGGKKIKGQRGYNKDIEYRPDDAECFFGWCESGFFEVVVPGGHCGVSLWFVSGLAVLDVTFLLILMVTAFTGE